MDHATVTESKPLRDRVTGLEREVDVVIETQAGPYPFIIGIECRERGRAATIEWVNEAYGKHKNLPTDKLILVAKAGFTPKAAEEAEMLGIETLSLTEAQNLDWTQVVGKLKELAVVQPQIHLERAVILPPLPSDAVIDVHALLYNQSGEVLGSVLDALQAHLDSVQGKTVLNKLAITPGNYAYPISISVPSGDYIIDQAQQQHPVESLNFLLIIHIDEPTLVDLQHRSFRGPFHFRGKQSDCLHQCMRSEGFNL